MNCRKDFHDVVKSLKEKVAQQTNEDDRKVQLVEFRKIVQYHNRYKKTPQSQEVIDAAEFDTVQHLFTICNFFKANEEGVALCSYFTEIAPHLNDLDLLSFLPKVAKMADFVEWTNCSRLFNSILLRKNTSSHPIFMTSFANRLLEADSSLRNQAAVEIFKQLYAATFTSTTTLSDELLAAKWNLICNLPHETYAIFLQVIFQLEHRQLLGNQLMVKIGSLYLQEAMTSDKLEVFDIDLHYRPLHKFVELLSTSPLVADSSFEKKTGELQHFLLLLCDYFLNLDFDATSSRYYVSWIILFVFVGRRPMVQNLMDRICSCSSGQSVGSLLERCKILLDDNRLQKQSKLLKAVRGQLKRTNQMLLKRRRYEFRQSISQLKNVISRRDIQFHPFFGSSPAELQVSREGQISQLSQLITLRTGIPLNYKQMCNEETEEEFVTLCDLIRCCSKLEMTYEVHRLFHFYFDGVVPKEFWFRPELLSVLAEFISLLGWNHFCGLSSYKDRSKFMICLINELLHKKLPIYNKVAQDVFTSLNFCIAYMDDHSYWAIYFHDVLLLERSLRTTPILNGIQSLRDSSITTLHNFVKILFGKFYPICTSAVSPLLSIKMTPLCQKTLGHLCSRFLDHLRYDLDTVTTEELLNWMRLFAHLGKSIYITFLIYHLFFNLDAEGSCNLSIRKLLTSEEFRNDDRLKIFRRHWAVTDWNRQQKKESFAKLFTPRSQSNKRKASSAKDSSSSVAQKRSRVKDLTKN